MSTRSFSGSLPPPPQTIDDDAPHELRVEWESNTFDLAKEMASDRLYDPDVVTEWRVYEAIIGALGKAAVADVRPDDGYLKEASEYSR